LLANWLPKIAGECGNSQDSQLISLFAENFWKETGSTWTASATTQSHSNGDFLGEKPRIGGLACSRRSFRSTATAAASCISISTTFSRGATDSRSLAGFRTLPTSQPSEARHAHTSGSRIPPAHGTFGGRGARPRLPRPREPARRRHSRRRAARGDAMVRAANLASCRRYSRSSVLRIFGVRRFGLKPRSESCAKT
jgi:hypothetical protein